MSEELLCAARNGDEEAFSMLYQKYFPLLLRLKNIYYLRNYVSEDWEQEARIALYQALKTYENNKGVSFGSYYKSIISNQIYSLLRKQNALKRRDQKNEISIEQKIATEGPDFLAEITIQEPVAMQQLLLKEAFEDSDIKFSTKEAKIFQHYMQGNDFSEMERELSMDLKQIKSAYGRVKYKIKKHLKDYNE
ncbi:sigma-70 family RNA polymerase sigma factor [Enterococcus mundtii]|uniref:DNA-directed RNA polymerase sigma-70 factor n=1 Tax=Enterococcus mundtii TaxID=53346 RepID=A0ABQ0VDJ1_ENTMU|nr:sigma-70 family RNA polymerase sigma factor [Enterococcus mundtii]GEN17856.1 DNA-directed RNA polymerase sigma-70 factor [Ligilactobacillus acidipiscis]AUB53891.1 RNA polymerase subunit sigma-70 [Enterococcus mundtii]MZZ59141.1 sigma-70 family RNA polymerase sigma factor [Enterococcus mundtii]MZZ62139.1 sigma-70 family RNA polymerase sigma factor [Enterococcus mundtii]MZZ69219.1 sigma-70 family RNA polymerase sigma factor [Enterococcus mundtii]